MLLLVVLFFHCFTFIIVALACHYSYLPQSILYPNLLALTMSEGTKLAEKEGLDPPCPFGTSGFRPDAFANSATSPMLVDTESFEIPTSSV